VARTDRNPEETVNAIRGAVRPVDKKLPLAYMRTLDEVVDRNLARPRFITFVLGIFGLTAVLLAAVGAYGVIAYAVTQRTREIGIRMALGAVRARVVRMVAADGLRLAAAGTVCGLVGAFALTRLIESLLFEVSPTDPWTFAAAAAVLLLVGLTAASIPARRASRIDPVVTLRCE